ncbi:type IV secretion system DotC family protein (plasmid) [Candidatus Fukatsuia symbiotica]|uniref:Conjugal transfer protein n=1 Tax=Candidatus Fukatsuia symbiotica TaxID=1878942 RepID=A0A2Y9CKH0_9GAMM|nr:type IV secretion system DotC family protein [Candidatus Fukatsuia symbiotica]AWK15500.1 conjugal transfer protein [Candidatus Fukatsuia symbiotica]MEA9445892.1 type IV secretion system DotC family protein [Candidatus Fukatsuia symbiotica]
MKKPALAGLMLLFTLPVFADEQAVPPPDIKTYLNPSSQQRGMSDTVYQMLTEAGRTLGFRGGKAQRAWELQAALRHKEPTLNTLYDFRPLISRQGWLPPVIAATKDIAHITADQIRTASRVYNIVSSERFVSNPPGWRQYLLAGLATAPTALPASAVLPKDGQQRTIWRQAVEKGWSEGRDSADHTLEANFNRLTRDYAGMLHYSTLLQQGMVTAPRITEQQQTVTGTPDQLIIGDKVKRLKQRARFDRDKTHWQPIITTEK